MRLPGIVETTRPIRSDDWFTPPHILIALGLQFDCDPASPEGGVSWIPAQHYHTEPEDGLTAPWHGLVWLNPPYSNPGPWVARLKQHGNGLALVSADTSTGWWHDNIEASSAVCFLRGRLHFLTELEDIVKTNARFPSVLIAYGEESAVALLASGLGWCVKNA